MPTIYFAGTEDVSFEKEGSGQGVGTSTSQRRTEYSRVFLNPGNSGGLYVGKFFLAAPGEMYHQARVYYSLSQSGPNFIYRRSGTAYWRVNMASNTPSIQVFDGGVWTNLATAGSALATNTLMRLKTYLLVHPTAGIFRLWADDSLICEATGVDTQGDAPDTNVDFLALAGNAFQSSEHMIMDEDPDVATSGLKTLAPNGAGAVNTWTSGTFADVDETTESAADLMLSDTANQEAMLALTNGNAGESASNIIVAARARKTASGPQQIQLGIRPGSTNHWTATKALPTTLSEAPVTHVWNSNPDTTAAFTETEINNLQAGYKSIA